MARDSSGCGSRQNGSIRSLRVPVQFWTAKVRSLGTGIEGSNNAGLDRWRWHPTESESGFKRNFYSI
jgi:hypothetical protein